MASSISFAALDIDSDTASAGIFPDCFSASEAQAVL